MLFLDLMPAEAKQFDGFYAEFELAALQIGIENPKGYYEIVFCAAVWIIRQRKIAPIDVWVQGISGGQGSGKSTFAMLLKLVFERVHGLRVLTLSLDDFYLTRKERKALSEQVTPLLETRGVPGTHDVNLMNRIIADVCANRQTLVPRFDKAIDDREQDLEIVDAGVDILIVEGWCLGATGYSQSDIQQQQLCDPVNTLESIEDKDYIWRRYVNSQLTGEGYQALFRSFGGLFYLAIPNWEAVMQWRSLQETKLVAAKAQHLDSKTRLIDENGEHDQASGEIKTMDRSGIERFIMFYERLTKKMLVETSNTADFTFSLNKEHEFFSVHANVSSP